MHWSTRTSTMAQTLFAQLEQTVFSSQTLRSIAGLSGGFSKRVNHGKTYWYYRFSDPGQRETQIYLGPDSPHIQALIERKNEPEAKEAAQHIRRLIRACAGAGCHTMAPLHFRLIKQLAHYGFFHAGGVLAGSHAFAAFANAMGIKWSSQEVFQTMDVDFSHAGRNISVALPSNLEIDTTGAIESLEEGFLPRVSAKGRAGSWVHPKDLDYEIDFLTPKTSDSLDPFEYEPLGIALQPLRFMEYSLINVRQTVIFDNNDAVVINLPDPARYALHKLLVYNERSDSPKAQKDLRQSAALIEILKQDRPQDLIDAWDDMQDRGPKWRKGLAVGLMALQQYDPEPLSEWVDAFKLRLDNAGLPAWRRK